MSVRSAMFCITGCTSVSFAQSSAMERLRCGNGRPRMSLSCAPLCATNKIDLLERPFETKVAGREREGALDGVILRSTEHAKRSTGQDVILLGWKQNGVDTGVQRPLVKSGRGSIEKADTNFLERV